VRISDAIKSSPWWIGFIFCVFLSSGCSTSGIGDNAQPAGRLPGIQPDYTGITLPATIAPLNFSIKEAGLEYMVQIHSTRGNTIRIHNTSGIVQIPLSQWKDLLSQNPGEDLLYDISMKNPIGQWVRFDVIKNHIAQDPMDGYLAFRRFKPLYSTYATMGIFQRCLENFDEKPLLLNRMTGDNCLNCHNFLQNGTDRWLLHMRGGAGTSMLLVVGDNVRKIDTKTKFNGPVAYEQPRVILS